MLGNADNSVFSAFFGVFVDAELHSQILAEKWGKEKATIPGGFFLFRSCICESHLLFLWIEDGYLERIGLAELESLAKLFL
jgi:hypothetical protein